MSTVPDKKTSKSRTKSRYKKWVYEKQQKLLRRIQLVPCPQCRESKMAHTICANCGAYNSVKEIVKKKAVESSARESKKAVSKSSAGDTKKTSSTKKNEDKKSVSASASAVKKKVKVSGNEAKKSDKKK